MNFKGSEWDAEGLSQKAHSPLENIAYEKSTKGEEGRAISLFFLGDYPEKEKENK